MIWRRFHGQVFTTRYRRVRLEPDRPLGLANTCPQNRPLQNDGVLEYWRIAHQLPLNIASVPLPDGNGASKLARGNA